MDFEREQFKWELINGGLSIVSTFDTESVEPIKLHNFEDKWEIVEEATYFEEGVKGNICVFCGEPAQEQVQEYVIDPTCEKDGKKYRSTVIEVVKHLY